MIDPRSLERQGVDTTFLYKKAMARLLKLGNTLAEDMSDLKDDESKAGTATEHA